MSLKQTRTNECEIFEPKFDACLVLLDISSSCFSHAPLMRFLVLLFYFSAAAEQQGLLRYINMTLAIKAIPSLFKTYDKSLSPFYFTKQPVNISIYLSYMLLINFVSAFD